MNTAVQAPCCNYVARCCLLCSIFSIYGLYFVHYFCNTKPLMPDVQRSSSRIFLMTVAKAGLCRVFSVLAFILHLDAWTWTGLRQVLSRCLHRRQVFVGILAFCQHGGGRSVHFNLRCSRRRILFFEINLSNIVALLLATFDLRFPWFLRGFRLYISEDFYMGLASLKTSPPLWVPLCEEKSTCPFSKNCKEEKSRKG